MILSPETGKDVHKKIGLILTKPLVKLVFNVFCYIIKLLKITKYFKICLTVL